MKFGLHNNSFRPVSGRVADIYPQLRERVQWAEANGFDYCSVMDHLWQIPLVGPAEEPFMEAWVTLGAIAAATERVHLTTMVTSVGYRNPALLAKMVATLDLISGGRALLGIGAGNTENEHNAYGYPFPRPGVRLAQLREAVQLIKALWQEERATYEGKQFTECTTERYDGPGKWCVAPPSPSRAGMASGPPFKSHQLNRSTS